MHPDANDTFTHDVQYFHDGCVVRPFEVSQFHVVEGHPRQLGDCLLRVLFPGTGKPYWLV
jgi:hypothetical protein